MAYGLSYSTYTCACEPLRVSVCDSAICVSTVVLVARVVHIYSSRAACRARLRGDVSREWCLVESVESHRDGGGHARLEPRAGYGRVQQQ